MKRKCGSCFGDRILLQLNGCRCFPELAHLIRIDVTASRLYLLHLVRIGVLKALPAHLFLIPAPSTSDNQLLKVCVAVPGWLGLPRLATLSTNRPLVEVCFETINCLASTALRFAVRCSVLNFFCVYIVLCGSPTFSLPLLISATLCLQFVDLSPLGDPSLSSFSNPSDNADAIPSIGLFRLVQVGEINVHIHRLKCLPSGELIGYPDPSFSHHHNFSGVQPISPEFTWSRSPKSSLFNSTLSLGKSWPQRPPFFGLLLTRRFEARSDLLLWIASVAWKRLDKDCGLKPNIFSLFSSLPLNW
ncbi:unnamed protein product [Dicrocoelium dendriticum]|nr:unnamed protein product [Dicrocoelium dendriticum]